MFARSRRPLLLSGFALLIASAAWAQVTTIEGDVKDENNQPVKDAQIELTRTDIKGHYQVKSNKKGHWFYTGLPFGTYDITCAVGGQVVDKISGVRSKYGDSTIANFDTGKMKQQQAAAQKAAETGTVTDDQTRGMSADQKAKLAAQMKERSEQMKKNKALNDAFNAAQDALKAKDYKTAVDNFTKAGELDDKQVAVWQGLGDAYTGLAVTQTGDDKQKSYDAAIDAFKKSLVLNPNDAAVYNQMGNIYGTQKKIPEATDALNKAAQLDPKMAAKALLQYGCEPGECRQQRSGGRFLQESHCGRSRLCGCPLSIRHLPDGQSVSR